MYHQLIIPREAVECSDHRDVEYFYRGPEFLEDRMAGWPHAVPILTDLEDRELGHSSAHSHRSADEGGSP